MCDVSYIIYFIFEKISSTNTCMSKELGMKCESLDNPVSRLQKDDAVFAFF